MTSKRLSPYEITRLVGTRAQQLSEGAEPLIEVKISENEPVDWLDIAIQELRAGKSSLILVRKFPMNRTISQKCDNAQLIQHFDFS